MSSPKSIDTHTKLIGEMIKNLFMGYEEKCFTWGKPEIVQATKDTARYITNEIAGLDYDLEIIREGIRFARDESPKKHPTLTEILLKCKKLSKRNDKPEPEPDKPTMGKDAWKKTWISEAEKGNPYAIAFVERVYGLETKQETK